LWRRYSRSGIRRTWVELSASRTARQESAENTDHRLDATNRRNRSRIKRGTIRAPFLFTPFLSFAPFGASAIRRRCSDSVLCSIFSRQELQGLPCGTSLSSFASKSRPAISGGPARREEDPLDLPLDSLRPWRARSMERDSADRKRPASSRRCAHPKTRSCARLREITPGLDRGPDASPRLNLPPPILKASTPIAPTAAGRHRERRVSADRNFIRTDWPTLHYEEIVACD